MSGPRIKALLLDTWGWACLPPAELDVVRAKLQRVFCTDE
jgi:hypothetical protein